MRALSLALLFLALPLPALAEFPERPVRIVVPFPAGSGTDIVARELGAEMAKDLKQAVVIDNKPGAQGIIGVTTAVNSPADGYTTVLLGVSTGASNVSMYKKLAYDPVKDLTPIASIADQPIVLVAAPGFKANDAGELFKLGQQNPGKLTYAFGSGSAQVAAAKLVHMGDIKTVPVPYQGAPQALVDVMSGQVDFMFVDISLATPQIQAGKLKALGVTSRERFPVVPDIKTLNESGASGYELSVWFALAGPAGIPAPIANRLSAAVQKSLQSLDLQAKYAGHGLRVKPSTPQEFGEFLKSEIASWGALIRQAGIQPQ